MSKLKPGMTAPASGQYDMVGSKGGLIKEVTAVKGNVMPPTTKPGGSYQISDRTNNKSGKGK